MGKYLIRTKKPCVYHLFDKDDTLCKQWSTNGLLKKNYHLTDEINNLRLCNQCANNKKKGFKDAL